MKKKILYLTIFIVIALFINFIVPLLRESKARNTGGIKEKEIEMRDATAERNASSLAKDSDWAPVAENQQKTIEINLSSVQRNGNVVKMWIRTTYKTDDSRKQYVDNLIKNFKLNEVYQETKKWIDYDNTYTYVELNKNNDIIKIIYQIEYNKNGSILHSYNFSSAKNESNIVPGTLLSGLKESVFRKFKFLEENNEHSIYLEEVVEFIKGHPNSIFQE